MVLPRFIQTGLHLAARRPILRLIYLSIGIILLMCFLSTFHYSSSKDSVANLSSKFLDYDKKQQQQLTDTSLDEVAYQAEKEVPVDMDPTLTGHNDNDDENKSLHGYEWIVNLVKKHNPQLSTSTDKDGKTVGPFTKYKYDQTAKQIFALDKSFEGRDAFKFTKDYLKNDLLVITEEEVQKLQATHSNFVNDLTEIVSEGSHSFFGKYTGSKQENNKQGIVFVGGGKFSWLSLQVIEQLRLNGNTLPIEVFIGSSEEYDPVFCEEILPLHADAKCVKFEEEFKGMTATEVFGYQSVEVIGFQYKALALLVSSFSDILLLDSDNSPVHDISSIFDSKVYKDKGLLIWPDPWTRTTNPVFYDIAGLQVTNEIVRGYDYQSGKEKEVGFNYDTMATFHDLKGTLPNPTAESGMMFVSKTRHLRTLLLALYYNIYGPGIYYPLLTQGGAGEGDKETFLTAAFVLNEPYHQLQAMFDFIGYFKEDSGEFSSKALGQKDPVQDYENFLRGVRFNPGESKLNSKSKDLIKEPRVIFMHLSYPKFTPQLLMDNDELFYRDPETGEERHRRLYGASTSRAGYDFELRVFQVLNGLMCDNNIEDSKLVLTPNVGNKFKFLKDADLPGYCAKLGRHVDWLRINPETTEN